MGIAWLKAPFPCGFSRFCMKLLPLVFITDIVVDFAAASLDADSLADFASALDECPAVDHAADIDSDAEPKARSVRTVSALYLFGENELRLHFFVEFSRRDR